MLDVVELNIGAGYSQTSYADYPGIRLYMRTNDQGFPVEMEHTDGAIVLYDPLNQWHDLIGVYQGRTVEYTDLPSGPMIEHQRRAMVISIALDDGAYIAGQQLWAQLPLLDIGTVHKVARPHYCRWRDYLAFDCNIPYLLACLTAAHYTDFFGTRRSRYLGF